MNSPLKHGLKPSRSRNCLQTGFPETLVTNPMRKKELPSGGSGNLVFKQPAAVDKSLEFQWFFQNKLLLWKWCEIKAPTEPEPVWSHFNIAIRACCSGDGEHIPGQSQPWLDDPVNTQGKQFTAKPVKIYSFLFWKLREKKCVIISKSSGMLIASPSLKVWTLLNQLS